jgi:hypothetical protein
VRLASPEGAAADDAAGPLDGAEKVMLRTQRSFDRCSPPAMTSMWPEECMNADIFAIRSTD